MKNIYQVERGLERVVSRIESSKEISENNKATILRFRDDCFAIGMGIYRVLFYMNRFWQIGRWIDKDFEAMTKEDLKALVRKIWLMENYAYRTKMDYNVTLKRFYKWLEGNDEEYPEKIKWVNTTEKKANRRLPEDILTREDVQALIKACTHIRDKALISALYEGGCRISELLNLKLKHMEFDEYGAILRVHGKTGSRRVRLVSSVPHLSNWVEHHPLKGEPDAPLWVCVGTTNNKKQMMYSSINTLLRRTAENAGVKKRVSPHSFRHARATHLASRLTEAQMKEYFGWTQGSSMAAVYVHMSGRDVDNAILQLHGKLPKDEEKANGELCIKECPRCRYENAPESDFCGRCRLPLDEKTAIEVEKKEKSFLNQYVTSQMVEDMVQKKVEEMLARTC